MFNELAERNTREEENGEISPRGLHVKRKDLTSLFSRKDTIEEIISRGKRRNHGLYAAIPDEGTSEALGGISVGCVDTGRKKGRERLWNSEDVYGRPF